MDSEKENKWLGIPDDIDTETESGDVLNDAICRRSLAVEEALNIKIVGTKMTNSKLSIGIRQSIMAGTDEVDAVFPLLRFVSTYVSNGWLVDMNTVDAFDFSGPWWNAGAMESLEIGGRLYAAVSDITHHDKLSANVTFVNSRIPERRARQGRQRGVQPCPGAFRGGAPADFELIIDKSQFFNRQDNLPCTIEDAVEMFTQNRVLFMLRPVQSLF